MNLPYFWLGYRADHNDEVLFTYEMMRAAEDSLVGILPDFSELQDDE